MNQTLHAEDPCEYSCALADCGTVRGDDVVPLTPKRALCLVGRDGNNMSCLVGEIITVLMHM